MKRHLLISLLLFFIFAGILFCAFDNASSASKQEDIARVSESIHSGILNCYAIEGKYPESLDYLEDNYGLYFNEDLYQIHYRYLGSNMMPEYKVFLKGDD